MKNYACAKQKRRIQNIIYKSVNDKSIICGLGGPNPEAYLKILKEYFDIINLFEKDKKIFQSYDLKALRGYNTFFYNENILKNLDTESFYDLDFCCTIETIVPMLSTIKEINSFAITIAMRGIGYEKTKRILSENGIEHGVNGYQFFSYCDTSPMMIIFKK